MIYAIDNIFFVSGEGFTEMTAPSPSECGGGERAGKLSDHG
jgi:hypothetical protein